MIALALREIGQLRLLETALPQAIDLYRRSLDFQDLPDTHVDLAIAELQANLADDALAEADKALAADPNNARASLCAVGSGSKSSSMLRPPKRFLVPQQLIQLRSGR